MTVRTTSSTKYSTRSTTIQGLQGGFWVVLRPTVNTTPRTRPRVGHSTERKHAFNSNHRSKRPVGYNVLSSLEALCGGLVARPEPRERATTIKRNAAPLFSSIVRHFAASTGQPRLNRDSCPLIESRTHCRSGCLIQPFVSEDPFRSRSKRRYICVEAC